MSPLFRRANSLDLSKPPTCSGRHATPAVYCPHCIGPKAAGPSPRTWLNSGERCWVAHESKRVAVFHLEFREDLRYWVKADRKTAIRVLDLVEAVIRDPFEGVGQARTAQVCPRWLLVKAYYPGTPAGLPRRRCCDRFSSGSISLLAGKAGLLVVSSRFLRKSIKSYTGLIKKSVCIRQFLVSTHVAALQPVRFPRLRFLK